MVYDAENRQIRYTKASVTTTYAYDGDGRRVKKVDSTGTIIFVYNAGGQLIAEYHSDPVPPPAGGGGTSYLTSDHLGSARVVTKSDGTVKARYDYLPFGEELGAGIGQRTTAMGYSAADSTKQKFTQKERDSESGLDYFGERYYSSAQGRFTSCDPLGSTMRASDPQTMNRFVFVLNNPLKYVDPDGLKEKSPWEQLSDEERRLLAPKLITVKDASKLTAKDLASAGKAFNSLVTVEGDAQATATNIAAVQDFVTAAGGYKNSKVWQDITKIVQVAFQGPPPAGDYPVQSSEIHVIVADKKNFLADLQHEGYAVNTLGDKLFRGKYHPFDNASAFTPRINDPDLHFANNNANDPNFGPNYFYAHWDRASVNSREGGPVGDAVAGASHDKGLASPQAVRQYLKRTLQYPTR
jgi:RHS repeat-associated protein